MNQGLPGGPVVKSLPSNARVQALARKLGSHVPQSKEAHELQRTTAKTQQIIQKVKQLHVYMYPLRPEPPSQAPTHLQGSSRNTELSSCSIWQPFTGSFIHSGVCVEAALSIVQPPPSPCPKVHSLCLHLSSCPTSRLISTTVWIPYVCININTVFFLNSFTLYDRL